MAIPIPGGSRARASRPSASQITTPSASLSGNTCWSFPSSPPSSFPLVDWSNPIDVRAWLGALRDAGDDLSALAREGTRRPRRRVLARAEIRRQARAATRSLHGLLAEAEAVLAPSREGAP